MTFILNRKITIAATLLSLLFATSAFAKDTPGATQTSYGVSASGAFQFSIPIVVPKGRNGVTPNLSLSYSSGGGNGSVGVGWGLSGLSAITRCGKTIATNGVKVGVKHDDDDRFCLNGQQLIPISGTNGIAGSEYRTEIDGFAKIQAIGNGSTDFYPATAPSGWKVWAKDGSIYYYGSDSTASRSAQFKLPGTSSINRWNLYRMQDRYNNFYQVTYRSNDGLPQKIEYTFVSGSPKQKIEFNYEDRPDKRFGYVLGSKIERNDRLANITVTNNGAQYRQYNLSYQTAPVSGSSRLVEVQECGLSSLECMDPIAVVWSNDTKGFTNTTETGLKAPESTFLFDTYSDNLNREITKGAWADVNGDGLVDQVIAYRGPDGGDILKTYVQTKYSNGSWGWEADNSFKLPKVLRDYSRSITNASYNNFNVVNQGQLVDVNGDGLVDVVYSVQYQWHNQSAGTNETKTINETWINKGNDTNLSANNRKGWRLNTSYNIPDIMFSYLDNAGAFTHYNGWECSSGCGFNGYVETVRGRFVDINGDGFPDWVRAFNKHSSGTNSVNHIATWINKGNTATGNKWERNSTYDMPDVFSEYRGALSLRHGQLIDLNGDGRVDWLQSYHSNDNLTDANGGQQGAWLNTPGGFVRAPSEFELPTIVYENLGAWESPRVRGSFIDVNGDGLRDFVMDSEGGPGGNVHNYYGASNRTWLNTGRGWQQTNDYNVPFEHQNHRYIGHTGQSGNQSGANWPLNINGHYVDINQDGLVDYAQSYKDVSGGLHQSTWLNTGEGWDEDDSYNTGRLFFDYSGRDRARVRFGNFLDINGDGSADWLRTRGGLTTESSIRHTGRANQIASITTTLGVEVKPTFLPLNDNSNLYKKSPTSLITNTELLPAADSYLIHPGMYVTSELHTTNALADGFNRTEFRYAGAQVHRQGRGFLGFHSRTSIQWDDRDPIKTGTQYSESTTAYQQEFPYIGRPKVAVAYAKDIDGSSVLLNRSESTYAHHQQPRGFQGLSTYFPYMDQSTNWSYELNGGAEVRRVERNLDYNTTYGNLERDVTRVYSNTNQLLRESISDPVYKAPNLAYWLINQVASTTSSVDDGVGGQPIEISRASFTYANSYTGQLQRVYREPSNSDLTARLTTQYGYDTYGNITQQTVTSQGAGAQSRISKITYGAQHQGRLPTLIENAKQQQTSIEYDAQCDAPSSVIDPNNLNAAIDYDNFCRQTTATDVAGITTSTSYNDTGLSCFNCQIPAKFKITSASPGSADITTYLNHYQQPMIATTQGMGGSSETIEQKTDYDPFGRVVRESQPYFVGDERHFNYYSYDQLGRVTKTELPYNNDGGVTAQVSYQYRMEGELIKRISLDVKRRPTVSYANALGQITNIQDGYAYVLNQHDGMQYTYYSDGLLKSTTDAMNNVINVEYDDIGRRTKLIDPDLGTSTYAYNGFGELLSQTDNKGQTISMTYDKLGRLTTRNIPTVAGDPTASGGLSTWAYDTAYKGIGAVASVTGPNGYLQTFNYDAFGRSLGSSTTIEGVTMTESVSYDATTGFLSGRSYPISGYQDDSSGNPQPLPFDLLYQYQNGYLSAITNGPDENNHCAEHWRADKYDALGRTELETLGKLVTTKRSYLPGQNVLSKIESILQHGNASKVQDLDYTYDGVNNLTSRVDNITSLNESFDYDLLDRLTEHYRDGALKTSVQYNAIGNIIYKSDVGAYTYGAGSAGPHAVTSISPTNENLPEFAVNWEWNGEDETKSVSSYASGQPQPYTGTFQYDANGSVTQIGNRNVYWTAFDKPYQMFATQPDGSQKSSTFKYGPGQNRIYKEEANYSYDSNGPIFSFGSVTEKTIYLGKDYERIEKKDENGSWKTVHRYTIATGGNAIQVEREDNKSFGKPNYLLGDNLGSTNVVLNGLGEVEQRLAFDPWGMRMNVPGSNLAVNKITNRGYTGHEMDDEIGLINMNARIYDPYLGRFLSADPVLPDAWDMQQFNRYSYVSNNPLKFVDPTGNSEEPVNDDGQFEDYDEDRDGGRDQGRDGDNNRDPNEPDEPYNCIQFNECEGSGSGTDVVVVVPAPLQPRDCGRIGFECEADRNGFDERDEARDLLEEYLEAQESGRLPADVAIDNALEEPEGLLDRLGLPTPRNIAKKTRARRDAGCLKSETGCQDDYISAEQAEAFQSMTIEVAAVGSGKIAITGGRLAAGAAGKVLSASKKGGSTALRPVGSILETVEDIIANPNLLKGRSPSDVKVLLQKNANWHQGVLGQGSRKGEGWALREHAPNGNLTGRYIRFHPGSPRKGNQPYWRVGSQTGGKSEPIPGKL